MSTCATSSFTDCSPRSRSSTICNRVASAKAARAVDCTDVYIHDNAFNRNLSRKTLTRSQCEHCPKVVINEDGVTIGEDQNIVRPSHTEWNELAMRVRSGELKAA